MDCPSHENVTHGLFFSPWVIRRTFHDIAWVSISAGTVASYASLYSITRSHTVNLVLPDICQFSFKYHSKPHGAVDVCLVSVSTLVMLRELSQLKGERSF